MVVAPDEFVSLLQLAAGGGYGLTDQLMMPAIFFVAGSVISCWSPFGGVLQLESILAVAIVNARASELSVPMVIEAEYGLGVGVLVGLALSLMTVFSLFPPVRNALLETYRSALGRQLHSLHDQR